MQGKIWGTTDLLFQTESFSVHELKITKGGFCSEHYHKSKINLFVVVSGSLQITVWSRDNIEDQTILGPGQVMTIDPDLWHKFLALSEVHAFEIYSIRLNEDDICRRTIGGIEIPKGERDGD